MKRLAIASVAVGVLLAGFFAVLVARNVPSTPEPIGAGAVHVSRDGLTLWASVDSVAPTCQVKTAGGADVPLEIPGDGEVTKDGMSYWYLVARSAKSVPAGDYVVSCLAEKPGVEYAAGPRSSFAIFLGSLLGAGFSLLGFFALGTYLLTIGARRRRASTPPPSNRPHRNPSPRSLTPGTSNSGATNPGATNPGTSNPGTSNPGTSNPGATNRSTSNSGATNPGNAQPDYPPITFHPAENRDRPQDG
jgi:hypothetical protein